MILETGYYRVKGRLQELYRQRAAEGFEFPSVREREDRPRGAERIWKIHAPEDHGGRRLDRRRIRDCP